MHFLNNKRCQGVGLAAGSIAGGAALQRHDAGVLLSLTVIFAATSALAPLSAERPAGLALIAATLAFGGILGAGSASNPCACEPRRGGPLALSSAVSDPAGPKCDPVSLADSCRIRSRPQPSWQYLCLP